MVLTDKLPTKSNQCQIQVREDFMLLFISSKKKKKRFLVARGDSQNENTRKFMGTPVERRYII